MLALGIFSEELWIVMLLLHLSCICSQAQIQNIYPFFLCSGLFSPGLPQPINCLPPALPSEFFSLTPTSLRHVLKSPLFSISRPPPAWVPTSTFFLPSLLQTISVWSIISSTFNMSFVPYSFLFFNSFWYLLAKLSIAHIRVFPVVPLNGVSSYGFWVNMSFLIQ